MEQGSAMKSRQNRQAEEEYLVYGHDFSARIVTSDKVVIDATSCIALAKEMDEGLFFQYAKKAGGFWRYPEPYYGPLMTREDLKKGADAARAAQLASEPSSRL